MKIISVNIRGLGAPHKKAWIKEICKVHKPYMLGIQETKTKEVTLQQSYNLWGLADGDFAFVEASGNSGGILTMWNKNTFTCEFLVKEEKFLALIGNWNKIEGLVGCVNIYSPCDVKERTKLWSKLDILCAKKEVKWIFFGDFNEVRSSSERNNFTRVSDDGTKFSKLDRFLISYEAGKPWNKLAAKVLERKWSNHAPIILSDHSKDFRPTPFKFYNAWLKDKTIEEEKRVGDRGEFIETGLYLSRQTQKSQRINQSLEKANWGEIDKEVMKAKEEVKCWEAKTVSMSALKEEDRVNWISARRKWLDLEEKNLDLLRQKAKIKWIKDGDENTKLFHFASKLRERRNCIHGLNIEGDWVEELEVIKKHIF
ncbi:LOW QUALITY PROTEIN: hypothetical protein OSB04_012985 [Centaurea solstitialis]|uniref:Endonuclease/exonuclease/phosphatase domain-containing protein n=1 Tax=Centaurea solstitialis TaxID=347529 RepID=A0AA38TN14_9ASTR|nr:LOW QUALITY PROTEIN: hypothetical protein OSB04_012985 [Centaurea solstitialis]